MTEQKNNEIQNDPESQEIFKQKLKEETMDKLAKAIELNKKNSLSKEAREAKAEACALILMAMRAEIQLDPNDPLFQVFVQKQSWRNAMQRACKEVCDPGTDLFRKTLATLDAISVSAVVASADLGALIRGIAGFFSKHGVHPLDEAEVVNSDNWSDFYEEIPKDGGDRGKGPSSQHNSDTLEMAKPDKNTDNHTLQRFLSTRSAEATRKKITNKDFYKYLVKGMMGIHKTSAKSGLKRTIGNQQLTALRPDRISSHVA